MKTKIFYFTGTGNSLYIAKQIASNIDNSTVDPIVTHLDKKKIRLEEDVIGFVIPMHSFSIPFIVKDFLDKVSKIQASYIFLVVTSGGAPTRIFKHFDKYLKRHNKKLNAGFTITMVNNFLLYWDRPDDDKINEVLDYSDNRAGQIATTVKEGKTHFDREPGLSSFIMSNLLFPIITLINDKFRYFNLENAFYTDNSCNGCGLCRQICLSSRITIDNDKPCWDKNTKCTFCFACIHYCPKEAIQFSQTKSTSHKRYHNPRITAKEIASQKRL